MVRKCRSIFDCSRLDYFVVAPSITVKVTANFNTPLMVGQTGYTLTCDISGAERLNPTITYQWTKYDGTTQTPVGTNSTLILSPLRFSDIGDYTCDVTIDSTLLNSNIFASADNSPSVIIESELNQSDTGIRIIIITHSYSNSSRSTIRQCH